MCENIWVPAPCINRAGMRDSTSEMFLLAKVEEQENMERDKQEPCISDSVEGKQDKEKWTLQQKKGCLKKRKNCNFTLKFQRFL